MAEQEKLGILYGVGVGPGQPDLITLRAIRVLATVDVVLAASSSRNDYSLAQRIAAEHIPARTQLMRLEFPMTRQAAPLAEAWERNLERTAALLRAGKNAAFITLGDPLIYSTFGYLLAGIRKRYPRIRVTVVPGITSYQAAAAETGTVLCEDDQNLLLLSGVAGEAELRASLQSADNAVILKTYRNFAEIRACLERADLDKIFVSRLGLEGEIICRNLADAPDAPNYLSLILATKKRGRRTS
ncbi:MAG: precorrin-2 C(20)-methyltransferase [Deltaproteobacteria bacterium]|nr:precorrin-2 C(20)-methyltransferase [Deltaproteobacteria bacterium]